MSLLTLLAGLAIGVGLQSGVALPFGKAARETPTVTPQRRAHSLPKPASDSKPPIAPANAPSSAASASGAAVNGTSTDAAMNVVLPLPPLAPPMGSEESVAPAPATVESNSDSSHRLAFALHVGSYRSEEVAEQEVKKLHGCGFTGRAVAVDLGDKGRWYRVVVGGYPTREAAVAARLAILSLPDYDYATVIRSPGLGTAAASPITAPQPASVSQVNAPRDTSLERPRLKPEPSVHSSNAAPVPLAPEPVIDTAPMASAQQYYDFGVAQERNGDAGEAIEAFSKAIEIRPDHNDARNHLATLYIQTGRLTEAHQEILALRDAIPNDARLLFNEAFLAYKRQDWLNAQLALVRLFGVEPAHLPGHLLAGNVFEATGDLERALAEFAHAQRLAPEEPEVLYRYARLLDMTGRAQEALTTYEQFLDRAVSGDRWSQLLDAVRRRVELLRKA